MKVKVTIVNETAGHVVYEELEDCDAETLGEVYKAARSEYGRCTSKVYIDRKNGPPKAIGWVFEKRCRYTDVDETYLQQAWVCPVEFEPAKVSSINIEA